MSGLTNEQMGARRQGAFTRRGQTVTYRRYISSSTDFTSGEVTATYTNTTLESVLVWDTDHTTIIQSNGRYRVGDKSMRVHKTDYEYAQPADTDAVIHAGTTYSIIDWTNSGDGQSFVFVLRKP